MLEPFFCAGTDSPQVCYWAWRFITGVVIIFVGWKILMPKKEHR